LELVMDFSSIGFDKLIELAFIVALSAAAGWVVRGPKTVFDAAFLVLGWPAALIAFSMDLWTKPNSLYRIAAGLALAALFFLIGMLLKKRFRR
jgi:hypothetical protein